MISIVSLIYKSKNFADSVWESVHEYTPLLKTGKANFFFVANSPTIELLRHLDSRGYNFVLNENGPIVPEEVPGLAPPWYIRDVYKGWNRAIDESNKICVLVNSDHKFSPHWLENLLQHLSEDVLVSSQMVERKHPNYDIFPGALHCEFGTHPHNFQKDLFCRFVAGMQEFQKGKTAPGGVYMPVAFYKKEWRFPEGNFYVNGRVRYGDELIFTELGKRGYRHITALDSFVYHFKEGEQSEVLDSDSHKES